MISLLKLRYSAMSKIASLFEMRKKLKEFLSSIPVCQAKLVEQQKMLTQLQAILSLPKLYSTYLEEMQRRMAFQKVITKKSTLANEMFSRIIQQETERMQR